MNALFVICWYCYQPCGQLTALAAVAIRMGSSQGDRGRAASPAEERMNLEEEPPSEQTDPSQMGHGMVGGGLESIRNLY
jgi:hypothetical protein